MGPTPNHANPSRTGGHGAVKDDDEETTVGTMPQWEQCHEYTARKMADVTTVDGRQDRGLGGRSNARTECWCKGVGHIKTDACAANDRLAQWQCMKPSCPPSILADEGVGIGPCGWERGTGG